MIVYHDLMRTYLINTKIIKFLYIFKNLYGFLSDIDGRGPKGRAQSECEARAICPFNIDFIIIYIENLTNINNNTLIFFIKIENQQLIL